MKAALIDCIFIEVSRGRDAAILRRWEELSSSETVIVCSPVTVAETWHGRPAHGAPYPPSPVCGSGPYSHRSGDRAARSKTVPPAETKRRCGFHHTSVGRRPMGARWRILAAEPRELSARVGRGAHSVDRPDSRPPD